MSTDDKTLPPCTDPNLERMEIGPTGRARRIVQNSLANPSFEECVCGHRRECHIPVDLEFMPPLSCHAMDCGCLDFEENR